MFLRFKPKNVNYKDAITAANTSIDVKGFTDAKFVKTDISATEIYVYISLKYADTAAAKPKLTKITFGDKLQDLGKLSLAENKQLTEITLPASLKNLGEDVFHCCEKLSVVNFSGPAPEIAESTSGYGLFYGVSATVNYPANYGSWNSVAGNNYGGNLTWVGYSTEQVPVQIETAVVGTKDFGAVLTAPAGGWTTGTNTFQVSCENACTVAVSYDGGKTYVRLKATAAGDAYSFTAEKMDANTKIAVGLSGDANGDGKISNADITKLSSVYAGFATLDPMLRLLADANGSGSITNADITKLSSVFAGYSTLKW